ncbi:MAG: hypothetical protein K2K82_08450 [Muribaculaceae bacterium]|nr:hypothetical protein [Muribaculaceae bacterium]
MTSVAAVDHQEKAPYFSAPARQWWWTVVYLFCLSLAGLKFYPALLVAGVMLFMQWKRNRYFFLVELIILCTGSGFLTYSYPIKACDFAFPVALIGILIYRKDGMIRTITTAMLAYFAVLFILALTSVEPMRNQFSMIRYYLLIISFFIPLVTFADRVFKFRELIRVVILHTLVICLFFVVDSFVLTGFILTPGSSSWGESTFTRPIIFTFSLTRHYPPGLYWLLLLIIPLNFKWYRMQWYWWVVFVLCLISSRTNSLLFALVGCFVFFRPNIRQVYKYVVIAILAFGALYYVDRATGDSLRLARNIDSFAMLDNATSKEEIADFGSGRVAQIIPKMELLYDLDREWIGFGFLNREKTTNPIFQIENQYYSDISVSEETATGVEVTEIQTILDIGYFGLFIQMLFYFGVYFYIRKLRYSNFYLCLLVGFELLGIGGFAGLNGMQYSLLILGMVLGGIILQQKRYPI